MVTRHAPSTGHQAAPPFDVALSLTLDRCFDCDAPIRHNTGRCFPCQLGVKLRAAAAAMDEVRWAIANCRTCAAAFGYVGPVDGGLCQHCQEGW